MYTAFAVVGFVHIFARPPPCSKQQKRAREPHRQTTGQQGSLAPRLRGRGEIGKRSSLGDCWRISALRPYDGGHHTVCHKTKEYVRGDVHTNTAESSHALVKRGIVGIYHNVSREYLHRYLWQYDFLWNTRFMNDGDRTIAGIKAAEGKRLMYKDPIAKVF